MAGVETGMRMLVTRRLVPFALVLGSATAVALAGVSVSAGSSVPPNEEIDAARAGLAWYIGTNLPETVRTSSDLPG